MVAPAWVVQHPHSAREPGATNRTHGISTQRRANETVAATSAQQQQPGAKGAAQIPKPRINLVLYAGVLAPNAKLRAEVVRSKSRHPRPFEC